MHIFIPVILSFCFPFLLWLGGRFNMPPNFRFKCSAILIFGTWTLISILLFNEPAYIIGIHWLAGILFISSVILLSFMPWSVFCWGYTLSMLLRLAERKQVDNQDQWEKAYAGPLGISQLSKNRATVLIGLRFAYIENNHLLLTKQGHIGADILCNVSRFFGISQ